MSGTKFAQLNEKITKEGGHHAGRDLANALRQAPMERICLNGLFLLGHYMRSNRRPIIWWDSGVSIVRKEREDG
jgi:hypothetical protein